MQDEFDRHFPSLNIDIIGVNEAGADPTGFITDGRDLPWLTDTDNNHNNLSDIRDESWQVTYRDVVIVNEQSNQVAVYNLTSHDLAIEANYTTLRGMFTATAAKPPESNWQSPIEPLDASADGRIGPLDALLVINELGVHRDGVLPQSMANKAPYVDITGDGIVAPLDALAVINQLDVISELDRSSAALSSVAVAEDGLEDILESAAAMEQRAALSPLSVSTPWRTDAGVVDRLDSSIVDAVFASV